MEIVSCGLVDVFTNIVKSPGFGTIVAALIGFLGVGFTYWKTKSKEREAELRKEKFSYYKEYLSAYAAIVANDDTPNPSVQARLKYEAAFNTIGLFASRKVIGKVQELQSYLIEEVSDPELKIHNKILSELVSLMRADLNMPKKEQNVRDYWLFVSDARKEGEQ